MSTLIGQLRWSLTHSTCNNSFLYWKHGNRQFVSIQMQSMCKYALVLSRVSYFHFRKQLQLYQKSLNLIIPDEKGLIKCHRQK